MEGPVRANDRHARRRPFSTWMKRLANLKSSHADSSLSQKQKNIPLTHKHRKGSVVKNNPYPLSGVITSREPNSLSFTPLSSQRSRHSSLSQSFSKHSASISHESGAIGQPKSRPPTLATTAETAISDHAPSGAGTSATAARTEGDHNSTFSSPPASVRSLTTTLTTIQSSAAPTAGTVGANNTNAPGYSQAGIAPAIPAHLAPHTHPTTYQSATANNALSDDASILTLASSSKRRRRNSVDTNASIRALAPASMFGNSRESLPLSVLSGAMVGGGGGGRGDDGASLRDRDAETRSVRPGLGAERASLISTSGVTAPALASERNSYIGERKYGGDAASVRSGLFMHGRDGSLSGSIGGLERRERRQDRDRDDARSLTGAETGGMVTAPTSPLIESPIAYQGILDGNMKERDEEN